MFKTGWKCIKTRIFSREKKSKNAIFFFVLWMSLSFVWFKFTHTLCTIVLNSITIFTRNTLRLHFHFLFMRLSYWWYYPIEYRYLHSRRMATVSQKEEKSEEEKSAKFSNFFYVCPMVYPRQPNREGTSNINFQLI